jgi:hypothetical protein
MCATLMLPRDAEPRGARSDVRRLRLDTLRTGRMLGLDTLVVLADVVVGHPILLGALDDGERSRA